MYWIPIDGILKLVMIMNRDKLMKERGKKGKEEKNGRSKTPRWKLKKNIAEYRITSRAYQAFFCLRSHTIVDPFCAAEAKM